MMKKFVRGFTMIELLVVIAIIGVLAAVMLAGFNPVLQLQRARDARRISDVKAIANAMEQYYADDHYMYMDIGDEGNGEECTMPAGIFRNYINELPQGNRFPYICENRGGTGAYGSNDATGFCVTVELDATEGNCGGCDCVGGPIGTCTFAAGNTNFCVVQQQ